ncbi:hypothetical protein [Nonomuraea sp. NPDC050786]|uniref:hypothetical protein n=1 Tax=Nonomuraea sp. NPDC050786 TaxID=3154840 RepID=UPI00341018B0
MTAVALATLTVVGFTVSQLSGTDTSALATVDPTVEPTTPRATSAASPLGSEGEPALGAIPKIKDATPVPMPLDSVLTPMNDIKLIDQARDVAAAACMNALGFKTWTAGTIRTWDAREYREHDFFDYIDPAVAAESGYPRQADVKAVSSTFAGTKHEPTAEERKAYEGGASQTADGKPIPAGGCAGQADEKLYGQQKKLPADPRALAVASRSRALGDSRVRAALVSWQSCMQKAGVTAYQHPITAQNDPKWKSRTQGTPASDEEKRIAALDAKCQDEVNLVGVYKAVRAAYEQRLMEENKSKFAESKAIVDGWTKNAAAIMKSG